MRRLLACLVFAFISWAGPAHALDAGLDASLLDVNVPDVSVADAAADAETDAAADAETDAGVDAAADAASDSGAKDATSDACNPNVEPCTTRADTGTGDTETGDAEGSSGGGCSCDSAPFDAGMASPLVLVVLASIARRRKRA